ncbi:lipid kinase [Falsiroseomonas sp. HW251]|uniref:lipid kinase n=1 Tax=Falsiroseomonas sp. HW251 TaxID=3390998 RepID=UPI003D31E6F8
MIFTEASKLDPADVASCSSRRALLVVNPGARRGDADISEVLDVLRASGMTVEVHASAPGQTVSDAIRQRADEDLDCVVLGGGDGTLNEAATALFDAGLTLGILPMGTANDLARTLGIPPDPVAAAHIIAGGHTRSIDLGEVNGHPYFNVASLGFSADLARDLGAEAKKKWGRLGYGLAALRLLRSARPFSVWLDHDGTTEHFKTLQVAVGNGRFYGGGLTVASSAQPDDGSLDVYSLEVAHWWRLLALLPWLRRGTHGSWRDVRAFRTTELVLRTRRPKPINADGEIRTQTPARFRLLKQAIRVYAPAPAE